MLDVYHDPNDMEKINRQKLFDDFDNILERVEKENKGFIITDEGKADLSYAQQTGSALKLIRTSVQ